MNSFSFSASFLLSDCVQVEYQNQGIITLAIGAQNGASTNLTNSVLFTVDLWANLATISSTGTIVLFVLNYC